jgi:quercetin 2,3-dioxygenase
MPTTRRIKSILKSKPTIEGAGVHLKRAFGYHQVPQFDPFLMLDDFHTSNPDEYLAGFPWHPHRGIETITYILEGLVEHGDSMGNSGVIGAGDVQWMTAGSGIIHQEMPRKSPTGTMWGFQLWANLPAAQKMMAPRYRDVKASDIPEITLDSGIKIKIVSGEVAGISGPVRDIVIDPEFLDVTVPANTTFTHTVKQGHSVFAYILAGNGYFDDQRDAYSCNADADKWSNLSPDCLCASENVILYEHDGDQITITTHDATLRFLFLAGRPLNEPVAWQGPIVMNSKDELRVAFEEFNNGTFIKTTKI